MVSQEFVSNTLAAIERINHELATLTAGMGQVRDTGAESVSQLRQQMNELKAQMETLPTSHSFPGQKKFDAKHFKAVPWNGEASKFHAFEFHLKEFVKRESAALADAMELVEKEQEPTGAGFASLDRALDSELRWLLVNHTTGDAETLVRRLADRTGLETWRLIKADVEPGADVRRR